MLESNFLILGVSRISGNKIKRVVIMKNNNSYKKSILELISSIEALGNNDFDETFIENDIKTGRFEALVIKAKAIYDQEGKNVSQLFEEFYLALKSADSFMREAHNYYLEWDQFPAAATAREESDFYKLNANMLSSAARAKSDLLDCLPLAQKLSKETAIALEA